MIGLLAIRRRGEQVPCPKCGYDLRGAEAEQATCPECGVRVDVALARQSLSDGWFACPRYRMLWDPVAVAVCCAVFGFVLLLAPVVLLAVSERSDAALLFYGMAVVSALVAGWALSLINVARRYGSAEGALLSLLCHFVVVGYIGGVLLGGVAVAGFVLALFQDKWLDAFRLLLGVMASGVFLVGMDLLDHWIDRRSQRQRQHLRMQSMSKAGA